MLYYIVNGSGFEKHIKHRLKSVRKLGSSTFEVGVWSGLHSVLLTPSTALRSVRHLSVSTVSTFEFSLNLFLSFDFFGLSCESDRLTLITIH